MCVTRVWVCEPSIGLHPALLIQRSLLQCLEPVGQIRTVVKSGKKCNIQSVIPMLIKLELKTTLVLGLYKLSVLAIVRLLSSSQILFPPPPPRFSNAQLLQEKE